MDNISIHPAQAEDISAISHLLTILFEQEADFEPDIRCQQQAVAMIIDNPESGHFLVMKQHGAVIGTVNLLYLVSTAMGGKAAILEDMVIHPDWRGMGLGTQLLQRAVEHAREQGCLRLTLLTDSDNKKAQTLYQNCGFHLSKMVPMRLEF